MQIDQVKPHEAAAASDESTGVRWDAVVSGPAAFLLSPRGFPVSGAPAREASTREAPVELHVRLFGMRLGPDVKNPIVLRLASGFVMRDVMQELVHLLGPRFLRAFVSERGESVSTCRIFVNGTPVQDLAAPIMTDPPGASVEIILLQAIEGG